MTSTFQPSPQQLAIGDAVAAGDHNIIVDAKAGTGKTTTLKYIVGRIRREQSFIPPSIVFIAFNKNIVEQARPQFPSYCEVTTGHSLGFRALKDSGLVPRNVKVDQRKCMKMIWDKVPRNDPDTKGIIKLVGIMKSSLPRDEMEWFSIINHFDIDLENRERAVEIALDVVMESNSNLSVIDYDDMLYLPIIHNVHFRQFDWILVDEAQDTNDIQLEIFERLQKPRICVGANRDGHCDFHSTPSPTRLIAVGDPHQAIYGFRGANSDSMSRIAKRFLCKTYPLSVSYRCSKAVVKEAQRYLR